MTYGNKCADYDSIKSRHFLNKYKIDTIVFKHKLAQVPWALM